jgi:hypothetical protein
MTIEERPGSDFDSIFSRKATPWRRSASSGMVTSSSTSSDDRPSASVWTSTVVGANSGSTSTRAFWSWVAPTRRRTPAIPIAIKRNRTLVLTSARIMATTPNGSRTQRGVTPPLLRRRVVR